MPSALDVADHQEGPAVTNHLEGACYRTDLPFVVALQHKAKNTRIDLLDASELRYDRLHHATDRGLESPFIQEVSNEDSTARGARRPSVIGQRPTKPPSNQEPAEGEHRARGIPTEERLHQHLVSVGRDRVRHTRRRDTLALPEGRIGPGA